MDEDENATKDGQLIRNQDKGVCNDSDIDLRNNTNELKENLDAFTSSLINQDFQKREC